MATEERPKKRATSKPAKTTAETVAGLDRSKAIGFSEMRTKETPKSETIESLPSDHPMMQPRAKKTAAKRATASPEERFARREKAQRELDEAEGISAPKRGARYSGEGVESGRLTSTTNYPMPTSKSDGASQTKTPVGDSSRKAYDFSGSTGNLAYEAPVNEHGARIAGRSTEEQHTAKLRRLDTAKPHQVEGIKREINAHIDKYGHSYGAPSVCEGPGCTNKISFSEDKDYCGGTSCSTVEAKNTPTPRG
jgi:hypothetical protein